MQNKEKLNNKWTMSNKKIDWVSLPRTNQEDRWTIAGREEKITNWMTKLG